MIQRSGHLIEGLCAGSKVGRKQAILLLTVAGSLKATNLILMGLLDDFMFMYAIFCHK